MRTVWGLTGVGLVTFVLFACGVGRVSAMQEEPALRPVGPFEKEEPLRRAARRVIARDTAKVYGLDEKELLNDAEFFGLLYTRTGPSHRLQVLKQKKAEAAVTKSP